MAHSPIPESCWPLPNADWASDVFASVACCYVCGCIARNIAICALSLRTHCALRDTDKSGGYADRHLCDGAHRRILLVTGAIWFGRIRASSFRLVTRVDTRHSKLQRQCGGQWRANLSFHAGNSVQPLHWRSGFIRRVPRKIG